MRKYLPFAMICIVLIVLPIAGCTTGNTQTDNVKTTPTIEPTIIPTATPVITATPTPQPVTVPSNVTVKGKLYFEGYADLCENSGHYHPQKIDGYYGTVKIRYSQKINDCIKGYVTDTNGSYIVENVNTSRRIDSMFVTYYFNIANQYLYGINIPENFYFNESNCNFDVNQ
ncbi:hypothetical protein [Methanocella sp. MCL-LM]|uniref:hypothetical protein n=1 Tax=Methanocella sp. MCL-LM TaxID=3412035 RepID=UPI003C7411E6